MYCMCTGYTVFISTFCNILVNSKKSFIKKIPTFTLKSNKIQPFAFYTRDSTPKNISPLNVRFMDESSQNFLITFGYHTFKKYTCTLLRVQQNDIPQTGLIPSRKKQNNVKQTAKSR